MPFCIIRYLRTAHQVEIEGPALFLQNVANACSFADGNYVFVLNQQTLMNQKRNVFVGKLIYATKENVLFYPFHCLLNYIQGSGYALQHTYVVNHIETYVFIKSKPPFISAITSNT